MKKLLILLMIVLCSAFAHGQPWLDKIEISIWYDSLNIKNWYGIDTVIQYNKCIDVTKFGNLNSAGLAWSCTVDLSDFYATNDTFIVWLGGTNKQMNIIRAIDFDAFAYFPDTLIVSELAHTINGVVKYTKSYVSGGNCHNFPIPEIEWKRLGASKATDRYIKWFYNFKKM